MWPSCQIILGERDRERERERERERLWMSWRPTWPGFLTDAVGLFKYVCFVLPAGRSTALFKGGCNVTVGLDHTE